MAPTVLGLVLRMQERPLRPASSRRSTAVGYTTVLYVQATFSLC